MRMPRILLLALGTAGILGLGACGVGMTEAPPSYNRATAPSFQLADWVNRTCTGYYLGQGAGDGSEYPFVFVLRHEPGTQHGVVAQYGISRTKALQSGGHRVSPGFGGWVIKVNHTASALLYAPVAKNGTHVLHTSLLIRGHDAGMWSIAQCGPQKDPWAKTRHNKKAASG